MSAKMNVPELRFREFSGEWNKKSFRDLVKLQRGSSPRPIVKFITKSQDGVNWIKIGDTKSNDMYIYSTKEKITKEGAEKSRKVSIGEIILSNSMSYGKPYILKINGYIHDGWFVIRKLEDNFDKQYLLQLLGSEWIQKQYKRLAAGGVVSNISSELVNSVVVNLPSKPEQEKIASFLSSVDTKIEQLTKKKTLLEQYKKGVMQKIFSQEIRFRDDDGSEYSEWVEKKINNVLKIGSGKDYKHLDKGSIPVYGTGGYMTSVNNCLYDGKSVCIGRKGTINKPMLISGKFWTVDTLFYTHQFNNISPEFFYYLSLTINWLKYNEGTTLPSLSKKTIESIKVTIPKSLKEQTKIANFLSSIDSKIGQTEKQINSIKEFKKALLQQMFV